MQIHIEPKDRFFVVRVSGGVNAEDLKEYIEAVCSAAERFGQRRMLLDEREVVALEFDFHEAYVAGESENVAIIAREGLRAACVPAPEIREKSKRFETLMQNRSVNYRMFDSIEDAEAWLLA